MKVIVLLENTSTHDTLQAEHGLSLWIEYHGKRFLLDAGSTGLFAENAERLGLDLSSIDAAVLSHGHYDHAGGFGKFFEINQHAFCYARAGMDGAYYSAKGGMHFIGVPETVLQRQDRFRIVRETACIDRGVYLVPHTTDGLESIGKEAGLYKKDGDQFVPDDFSHEQSLVFETEKGLVIFNSCSHGGADIIIGEVKAALGKNVYAYFGGLHMKGQKDGVETCTFSSERLDALAEKLKAEKLAYVFTGHCTGMPGFAALQNRLPGMIQSLSTGKVIEI